MAKCVVTYDRYHSLANLSADGKRALAIGKGKFKHYPDILVDYATIFDTETGVIIAQYTDSLNPTSMSLSPDGKRAMLSYEVQEGGLPQDPIFEYLLMIWDIENNTSIDCSHNLSVKIGSTSWLDNDHFVVTRQNGLSSINVGVYDVTGTQLSQFDYTGFGYDVVVNQYIAIGIQNHIYLINPSTGDKVNRFLLSENERIGQSKRSLFYAPNGSAIAILQQTNNTAILVWDLTNDVSLSELKGDRYMTALAWSPDSTQLLSAQKESDTSSGIYIWDIATGEKKLFTEVRYESHDAVKSLHWYEDKIYITTLRLMTVWEL